MKRLLQMLFPSHFGSRDDNSMTEIKVIVGLGNPGTKYTGTRHNIGFEIIDKLAGRLGTEVKKKKYGGLVGETFFDGTKLMLVKPQSYMNRSGQAVATIKGFFQVPVENMLVITDDMAIEAGIIRLRKQGSAGGHNGLKDIIAKLGTNQFPRLRVGIGQSGMLTDVDFVLSRPSAEDRELIEKAVENAVNATLCWLTQGAETAMNKYNVKNNG